MRERTYRHRRTGRAVRERRITSLHEASHAAVAIALGIAVEACGLETVAQGFTDSFDSVGAVIEVYALALGKPRNLRMRLRRALRPLYSEDEVRRSAVVSAASAIAEARLLGRATAGTDDDDDELIACAELLGYQGRAIRRFVDECDNAARLILDGNAKTVEVLAKKMRERKRLWRWRTVTGAEAKRILGK